MSWSKYCIRMFTPLSHVTIFRKKNIVSNFCILDINLMRGPQKLKKIDKMLCIWKMLLIVSTIRCCIHTSLTSSTICLVVHNGSRATARMMVYPFNFGTNQKLIIMEWLGAFSKQKQSMASNNDIICRENYFARFHCLNNNLHWSFPLLVTNNQLRIFRFPAGIR